MNEEEPDDYDHLHVSDPYEMPGKPLPVWLERVLNLIMPVICLSIVFAICGAILWFVPYGFGGRFFDSGSFATNETAAMSWGRFIFGGIVGVVVVLIGLRKRPIFSESFGSIEEFGERHILLLVAAVPLLIFGILLLRSHFKAAFDLGGLVEKPAAISCKLEP